MKIGSRKHSAVEDMSQESVTASSDPTMSEHLTSKATQASYSTTQKSSQKPSDSIKTGQQPVEIEIRLTGVPSTPSGLYQTNPDQNDVIIEWKQPEKHGRQQWASRFEFYLSLIGYAVGLGNVWRFPYLVYENGGGAFLIPYTIALFVIGMPIFYLELLIGQYASFGPTHVYKNMVPLMAGLGWCMVFLSVAVCFYYNVILAWALYYIASSFTNVLPWSTCKNTWNQLTCYSTLDNSSCEGEFGKLAFFFEGRCHNASAAATLLNRTNLTSSASEYFDYSMYDYSQVSGFDLGTLQWKLVLALLLAWFLVAICTMWGIKSLGKVVYFTATFPYIILVILIIRGVTLEGAGEGLTFYLKPDLSKLRTYQVWLVAATQIFFSLGPCAGSLITMASFNKFHDNCFQTAMIVSLINSLTSFLAGFAVFSTLGFMAGTHHKQVKDVVADGVTLTFVTYPEAVANMPVGQLWSILFFTMIVTLALDTEFAFVDVIVTAICDQWGIRRRWAVVQGVCTVLFFLGMPMTLQGGDRLLKLIDSYSAPYALLYLAVIEELTVMYLYGHTRFTSNIRHMLGAPKRLVSKLIGSSGWYWRFMWLVPTPLLTFAILISSLILYTAPKHRHYTFSSLAQGLGFVLAFTPLIIIIISAVYYLVRSRLLRQPISTLVSPTPDWCPAEERNRQNADH